MSTFPRFECKAPSGSVDVEVVAVFQEKEKKGKEEKKKPLLKSSRYADVLKNLEGQFEAGSKSIEFVRFAGKKPARDVLFVGLGTLEKVTEESIRQAGGVVWSKLSALKAKTVSVEVDSFAGKSSETLSWAEAFAEGMSLSAYRVKNYKTEKDAQDVPGPGTVSFVTSDKSDFAKQIERVMMVGKAVTITRDWSNEPSNMGTPEYYAAQCKKLAQEYGLKCTVMSEAEAKKEKMNLFLAVGQGSEREGKVVILEYTPSKKGKTLCFVGKGITFDSGGISIKPSARMEEMKHDMTGAATVLGATLLAAKMKVPHKIVTIMGFTENMPDGNAITPSHVITARNGKTVEVVNTDAEGRLILADLLDLAHDYKPEVIIDAATLTGACGVALGKYCCAILGNDEKLIQKLQEAGKKRGEQIWELPLFDEYFDDMKSDYADMRNSANNAMGGTIRGAIFLKQFIKNETKWAHLDIASTAWDLGYLPYYPKSGASGAYVRALATFAEEY